MIDRIRYRLRYLWRRARRFRLQNLAEHARDVQKVSRAPQWLIIADMVWCSVRYEMHFSDYVEWDIKLLRPRERKTWMTQPKSFRYAARYNKPAGSIWLKDKEKFYDRFSDVIGRDWIDVENASADAFAAFLSRHERVIAKLPSSLGGEGIEIFETSSVPDAAAFQETLLSRGQTLLEEVLVQDPDMATLNPNSINTLRLITFYDAQTDVVHHLATALRMGNGGYVDNFARGGMYTMVDENGVALYPALDKAADVYRTHPVTGIDIVGFAVPDYAAVRALIDDVARRVPDCPYVGWDVAITDNGPVLIEGNHDSGVFQPKPSATGVRTGLLPVYRAAMGG